MKKFKLTSQPPDGVQPITMTIEECMHQEQEFTRLLNNLFETQQLERQQEICEEIMET